MGRSLTEQTALKQIRTIFFDRDGVINDVVMRGSSVSSPRTLAEFHIRPDFRELYSNLTRYKLQFFVVSNQPDVSRGFMEDSALVAMTETLSEFKFGEILYCRHDDSDGCACRKPKPGMIGGVLAKYGLEPKEALILGDSHKDVQAGRAAGIGTVLIRRPYNQDSDCQPDYFIDEILQLLQLDGIEFCQDECRR
jgi:D-glycero-D-manno-heptose 1,7-bisphosphate phosphatase